jgi:hypothetical protein
VRGSLISKRVVSDGEGEPLLFQKGEARASTWLCLAVALVAGLSHVYVIPNWSPVIYFYSCDLPVSSAHKRTGPSIFVQGREVLGQDAGARLAGFSSIFPASDTCGPGDLPSVLKRK